MMNPDAVGTVYPEVMFTVDPERVAAFRDLFGQNEGVPPTFVTAAEFTVFPQVIGDPNLGLDLRRVLHGSQEYQLRRPLREGETLRVRTRLEQIRQRAGTGFVTIATELVDDAGEVVATARSTMIEREAG
jgi:acyl dehydratase